MHIATCITSHNSIAKVRVPQQCCYWGLNLKSANLLATAIALEDNDEPIICTTGKQWPIVWEHKCIDRITVLDKSFLEHVMAIEKSYGARHLVATNFE